MPRRTVPDPFANQVGARIRELRTERRISSASLARKTGISRGHLSSIERGLVVVQVATLATIARALGVPLFYLAVDRDDPLSAAVEAMVQLSPAEQRALVASLRRGVK